MIQLWSVGLRGLFEHLTSEIRQGWRVYDKGRAAIEALHVVGDSLSSFGQNHLGAGEYGRVQHSGHMPQEFYGRNLWDGIQKKERGLARPAYAGKRARCSCDGVFRLVLKTPRYHRRATSFEIECQCFGEAILLNDSFSLARPACDQQSREAHRPGEAAYRIVRQSWQLSDEAGSLRCLHCLKRNGTPLAIYIWGDGRQLDAARVLSKWESPTVDGMSLYIEFSIGSGWNLRRKR